MLEEYQGNVIKIKMLCPKQHHCAIIWYNFKHGYCCGKCGKQSSKFEIELLKAIRKKYSTLAVLHKNREIIKPYEIEINIAIPKYYVAIEYFVARHYLPIYGAILEKRIENLSKIQKRDNIKRIELFDTWWTLYCLNDENKFNIQTLNNAIEFLFFNIDIKIQRIETSNAISSDDIGCFTND